MSKAMENAKNLYIRGIQEGHIKEVQDCYMGAGYVQHSTGVPDGKEGFAAFFTDFFRRHPQREIRIVRALEEGDLVFLHVHQNLSGGAAQWITADLFRADADGRIVEHWDVIDAYPAQIQETDPIFGDFVLADEALTAQNKKTVRRFLCDVLQNKEYGKLSDYVAKDLIQHNKDIPQGAAAYQDYIMQHNVEYAFVFQVMAQGNHVVAYSRVWIDGQDYALFDLFRLKEGKIVEHWDNKEPMPARQDLTNSGKF